MKESMPGKWTVRAILGLAAFLVGCGGGDDGPSAKTGRQLQASLAEYETYLEKNAAKLLHWTETIVLKVDEGSVPKAQSRYAASRIPYGRIDPVADLGQELPGFREIEAGIFGRESIAGLIPVAKQLRVDVGDLQQQLVSSSFSADQSIEGAEESRRIRDPRQESEQSRPQEPGIAFVVYGEFDPETIAEIAQPIEGLAELMSQAQVEVER